MAVETGAQSCIRTLHAAGVDACFANPGTTEMFIVAGLDACTGVRSVLCLHETVCTGAADGFGRMNRRPACTLLHLGPGLANGIANLHNARRARSPVINLVGDMATWHNASHDAPLCMNIAAIAATVGCVITCGPEPEQVGRHVARAIAATTVPASALASRVATLVLPHDTTWSTTAASPTEQLAAVTEEVVTEATAARGDSLFGPNADAFFAGCASGLRTSAPGAAALLLGGDATLADNGALHIAATIAAATGAALLCENGFARIDRGDALPALTRLPYFPREAAKALSAFSCLVLIDCKLPVPMFGYASGPRDVVSLSEDAIWEIDAQDAVAALRKLASALDIPLAALTPQMATKAVASRELSQELRAARDQALTPPLLCAVVAALQPANAIVVDESLTSGTEYWMRSANAPAFSHLTLTGGAIGQGPPMAVGAAVACPTRRVINFQADGSGLYSAQALWTQAREQLDIVTIICANNKYNILRIELALQRVNCTASAGVGRSLTDLSQPSVDWVSLAKGFGVANATRATTVGELADQLAAALARKGPSLIEACLP